MVDFRIDRTSKVPVTGGGGSACVDDSSLFSLSWSCVALPFIGAQLLVVSPVCMVRWGLTPAGTNPSHQRWFLPVSATLLRSYRCAVSRDERHCAATLRVR